MSTGQTQFHNSIISEDLTEVGRDGSERAVVTLVFSVLVVFNAVGLLLVVRRFAGAFSEELPRVAMLLTALVAGAVVACVRIAWRRKFPLTIDGEEVELSASQRLWDWVVGNGSSLSLLLLAMGCSFPGDRTSDWLTWLPLLVADQLWRQSFFDAGRPELGIADTPLDLEAELALASLAAANSEESISLGEPDQSSTASRDLNEEIVQQLYRVRDELGQEVIYGTLRADFLTGQRTAVIHAGFCPPLTHLPEIEAESFRGPLARIKVVQALAHGTRMDVRLAAPASSDCHVWIDMAATPVTQPEKIEA